MKFKKGNIYIYECPECGVRYIRSKRIKHAFKCTEGCHGVIRYYNTVWIEEDDKPVEGKVLARSQKCPKCGKMVHGTKDERNGVWLFTCVCNPVEKEGE